MKKLVILLVIILLCLVTWAGATYVVGSKIEANYTTLLEKYPRFGPVTLTGRNYQRGFLGSTAETVLHFKVPASAQPEGQQDRPESLEIVLTHTLKHGPLAGAAPALTLIETRLTEININGEPQDDFFNNIPQMQEPLALTKVGFDGTTQSHVQISPFTIEEDDGQITWEGFNMDSEYSPGSKTINGTLSTPGMKIAMPDGHMNWQGLSGHFEITEALPMLYVGPQEMTVGAFDMDFPSSSAAENKKISMDEIKITSDSQFDGKQVHYQQFMQFAGIDIDGETYGPGSIDIELKNLEAQPLSDFQAQVQEIYFGPDSLDPDLLLARLLPLYSQLFVDLGTGEPELLINKLTFATPMGNIDGRAQVKYNGQGEEVLAVSGALLQNLEASADLAVDESLVSGIMAANISKKLTQARNDGLLPDYSDEDIATMAEQQLQSQIEALLLQNLIVRDGQTLKSSAVFNQGQLEVNGQMLPLF